MIPRRAAAPGEPAARARRPVRSFVLRQGRMSPAQQRALETLLPTFGLPFAPEPLAFERIFGRRAPTILEIGFGMGETTAAIALARPGDNFLGIEVHGPGVGSLLKRIDECRLANVRVIRHDAVEVVAAMIPQASLAGIHMFFPDPWPKKRHHKRRLIQPGFVALLASRLAPGAYLHAATDWEYYRTKQDIRCRDCKLHSGFEGTVALQFGQNLKDSWRMVRHYMS